jgi:hypothetical protein
MSEPVLGVHAFYTSDVNEGQFKSVELLCQLASALYWKKSFGPIGLYISPEREAQVFHYGLHTAYTFVDTIHHEQVIMHGSPRYWAYPKMMIAKHLSLDFEKFCMLDADLYIKTRDNFDFSAQILAFHREETDAEQYPGSEYPSGPDLYKLAGLESPIAKWETKATNTAILYCNRVAPFIHEWMYHVDAIVENSYKWQTLPGAGDQIFVEQYLLPNLANERGISLKTYLNSSWIPGAKHNVTHLDPAMHGWIHDEPIDKAQEKFNNVFHIWGLKHNLNYAEVRREVLGRIFNDLDQDFPELEKSYPILFAEAKALYNDKNDYYLGILDSDKPKEIKNGKSKKHRPTTS